jgi:hypothetical protein
VLKTIIDRASDLPGWQTFADIFKLQMETSTVDAADSNLRFERSEASTRSALRLTLLCQVHMLSNLQTRMYFPVSHTISGFLAVALTMRAGGATYKCRKALEDFLIDTVCVVPSRPPGKDDPRHIYRGSALILIWQVRAKRPSSNGHRLLSV